jgi:hypothetical protein
LQKQQNCTRAIIRAKKFSPSFFSKEAKEAMLQAQIELKTAIGNGKTPSRYKIEYNCTYAILQMFFKK